MYFDLRNHRFSSVRFDGADRLATSVGSVAEWLAFRDESRRKDEAPDCEILAVPSNHCLGNLGYSIEEPVLRPVFLTQFQWLT